tara:strand:- start:2145 stop:2525 length:381 start_codon:yes stop_codon:yes gene_type:complete
MKVEIEVSIGELYDKITILRIKKERITDADKLHNIKKELQYLENKVLNNDPIIENLTKELFEINSKLWDIENNKRRCESENNFGWGFIQLARDVYFYNDKRAEIKRKINIHTNSDVVEEKQYTDYE